MLRKLRHILRSFPVQLLALHMRSNLLLMVLWLIIVLIMSGRLGRRLGFQYLFLDPEYLGAVNFWSFFLVGFAFGIFLMSWNLTTYLLSAHYFPFLASLARPFSKFCINNFILPLGVMLAYLIILLYFQIDFQELASSQILANCAGLIGGFLSLIGLYAIYFQLTNKDISYYQKRNRVPPNLGASISPGYRNVNLELMKRDENRLPVRTYLNERLQARLVRSVAHYETSLLRNIFRQNHLNALLMQLLTMLVLLILGYLVDYRIFQIPAGASLLIMFSLIAMLTGAVSYWFSSWRSTVIIFSLLLLNFITSFEVFERHNQAYGLNYEVPRATYSYEHLQESCAAEQVAADRDMTLQILENWKRKVAPSGEKPPMIVLCISGGGLRSATWSMKVLQEADSMLSGKLMEHTVLITGASGGMLGMAYMRELYLRKAQGEAVNPYDDIHIENISKDLLNPLAFTIVSNDLFLPWTQFKLGDHVYFKDRGYVFEEHFNRNTEGILDKRLIEYRDPEREAIIPMLYLSPSIVNDGRRLFVTPQNVSFMMISPIGLKRPDAVEVDGVDFRQLLAKQEADSLRFLTALRMNATYPYVLPSVHLPTQPEIELVDAGFRDNYGILGATRFLQVFQDWIKDNTSGVVLVQISSSERIEQISSSRHKGVLTAIFNPLGITQKVFAVQEFEHDNSLSFISDILGEQNFRVIRFIYYPEDEARLRASVSFHITQQEKQDVLQAISRPENERSFEQLQSLLNTGFGR